MATATGSQCITGVTGSACICASWVASLLAEETHAWVLTGHGNKVAYAGATVSAEAVKACIGANGATRPTGEAIGLCEAATCLRRLALLVCGTSRTRDACACGSSCINKRVLSVLSCNPADIVLPECQTRVTVSTAVFLPVVTTFEANVFCFTEGAESNSAKFVGATL